MRQATGRGRTFYGRSACGRWSMVTEDERVRASPRRLVTCGKIEPCQLSQTRLGGANTNFVRSRAARLMCAQGAVDLRTESSCRHAPSRCHRCSTGFRCGRQAHGRFAAERLGGVQSGSRSRFTRYGRSGTIGKPCGRRCAPSSFSKRSSGEAHSWCGSACGTSRRVDIRRRPTCHCGNP